MGSIPALELPQAAAAKKNKNKTKRIPYSGRLQDTEEVIDLPKSMCLIHFEDKQYLSTGAWSRERLLQGHARRQVAHALKSPSFLKAFSKAFYRQGEVRCSLCSSFVLVAVHVGQVM